MRSKLFCQQSTGPQFPIPPFASSLSPISINFFVGFMLVVCAVLAVVPSFFAGDDAETPGGETGRRRVLYDLELWWSVLRG